MKKFFLMICMALMAGMALNAMEYSGTIVVKMGSMTRTADVTVTVIEQENGLYELDLDAPLVGLIKMYDVPEATADNITSYSAVRNVATNYGTMTTNLLARTTNGMMAADVTIPARGITMFFNTVGNHFQLPNFDMEAWTNNNGEPDRWHGFKTATGSWAWAAPAQLNQSSDIHDGATGQYSALITAKSAFGTIANGTMTNGRLNAGSTSPSSSSNNASMAESNGDDYYMPLYAKPDKFNVWLKYTQGSTNANNKASVSVKTFDGSYYQEPVDHVYSNLSGSIVGGEITASDWTFYSFPFDYDSYAANNAESKAIFVTFSTNSTPGQGTADDKLYIDDIELVYLAAMTDLRYQGTTISGWNPAVTEYNIEMTEAPVLDDFTATIEGASAVVTKSMEQNADGSYRIAITVISGDLQTATSYVINVTVASSVMLGDVDGNGSINVSDATLLITYVLNGNVTINEPNADMDGNGQINISDITLLINYLLTH